MSLSSLDYWLSSDQPLRQVLFLSSFASEDATLEQDCKAHLGQCWDSSFLPGGLCGGLFFSLPSSKHELSRFLEERSTQAHSPSSLSSAWPKPYHNFPAIRK